MIYWDEMQSKFGFGDGGTVPPDAEACREVYVQVLNKILERFGSGCRAFAWNRPGMHNYCLILCLSIADYDRLTALPPGTAVDAPEEADEDEAWGDAVEAATGLGLDAVVETTTRIDDSLLHAALAAAAGVEVPAGDEG